MYYMILMAQICFLYLSTIILLLSSLLILSTLFTKYTSTVKVTKTLSDFRMNSIKDNNKHKIATKRRTYQSVLLETPYFTSLDRHETNMDKTKQSSRHRTNDQKHEDRYPRHVQLVVKVGTAQIIRLAFWQTYQNQCY